MSKRHLGFDGLARLIAHIKTDLAGKVNKTGDTISGFLRANQIFSNYGFGLTRGKENRLNVVESRGNLFLDGGLGEFQDPMPAHLGNILDPERDSDAATKNYVDSNIFSNVNPLVKDKVGHSMAGESVTPEHNGNWVVGSEGSEIFNDYRYREFDKSYGFPTIGNVSVGKYSHAEGAATTASGDYSHAEGNGSTASGFASHAEGSGSTTASGYCSHVEGYGTTASGDYSHAECSGSHASGNYSHAEGWLTNAVSECSHSEGEGTRAGGTHSHAEGYHTTASGSYSHAEGYYTTASGDYSHAGGLRTVASGKYQTVIGQYNVEKTSGDGYFIIGNGDAPNSKFNAFRVNSSGEAFGKGFNSSGADYAEYFEWEDGNILEKDRTGLFVTLNGSKIRLANEEDDFIIGIVSSTASVIGDSYDDQWKDMYLRDVFGRVVYSMQTIPASIDNNGKVIEPEHEEFKPVLNPDYDCSQEYIPRSIRPEWDVIGMLGKIVMIDDGTCSVNGYCKPGKNGVATKSDDKTDYRVMERIDKTHIRVFSRR